jgi:hypothetical protein
MTHGLSSDIFVNKCKQPPSLYGTAECTIDGKERKRGGSKRFSCFFFLLLLPKHRWEFVLETQKVKFCKGIYTKKE